MARAQETAGRGVCTLSLLSLVFRISLVNFTQGVSLVIYQGKTKGQQLKGQNRFIIFHNFSHFFTLFQNFSPRTFPFKTKGFSSRRTKEKK